MPIPEKVEFHCSGKARIAYLCVMYKLFNRLALYFGSTTENNTDFAPAERKQQNHGV